MKVQEHDAVRQNAAERRAAGCGLLPREQHTQKALACVCASSLFTLSLPMLQSELLDDNQASPASALPTAVLTTLRLARDELGFRPLAVAGDLQVGVGAVRVLGFSGRFCHHPWLELVLCQG